MEDISRMIAGFRRFHNVYFHGDKELFDELKGGQRPKTLIVGCCDSRVDPAIMTDSAPGELFVVRNVANLVPPYEPDMAHHGISSALEYAVCDLQVQHVVVLGHSQCGGIGYLMNHEGIGDRKFVGRWVGMMAAAKKEVLQRLPGKSAEVQQRACEQAAILLSLDNLLTFPWLRQRAEQGTLSLHGWYFDLGCGELLSYDPHSGVFKSLVTADAS